MRRPGAPIPPRPAEPTRPQRAWRRFVFSGLPRVTHAEAALVERLEWLLPATVNTAGWLGRLQETLETEVTLALHHVEAVKAADLPRLLSRPSFFAALSPAPHASRALLELELGLAHATVDAMLGGGGDPVQARTLTDIEEGVLGYLVLELLKALSEGMEPSLPRMRLESIPRTPEQAAEAVGLETHLLAVQFRVGLGAQSGFARVLIPASVLGVSRPPRQDAGWRARRRAEWERNAGRLSNVSAWLRAEVGYAEIASSDLGALQVRDVVLLDRVTARPHKGETGPAVLRLGRGRVGRMEAELLLEDGQYKAKITGFSLGEEPPPGSEPAGSGAESPGESTSVENNGEADGADLVADIPLQIAVELSRVSVSADQVVSLKVGQIVDLGRAPGDPVELSVNGKLVARGELVEVEGSLGVRISALL